jgi:hypothetical protein
MWWIRRTRIRPPATRATRPRRCDRSPARPAAGHHRRTGFYYRALVRGLFPGPARDDQLRARLTRVAGRRGVEWLHRWLTRVDPASAARIQPRDLKRIVRALEVYLLTGRPLTDHFEATASPVADYSMVPIGLNLPREVLRARVASRVAQQFARGVVGEGRRWWRPACRQRRRRSRVSYRQVMELQGVRDDAATARSLCRRTCVARCQLIRFRKEPGVRGARGGGGTTRCRHGADGGRAFSRTPNVVVRTEATMFSRVLLIIMDSVGAGELPDARRRRGQRHVKHCKTVGLRVPARARSLARIAAIGGPFPEPITRWSHGEASAGKDSVTGHWEMTGIVLTGRFDIPRGFAR